MDLIELSIRKSEEHKAKITQELMEQQLQSQLRKEEGSALLALRQKVGLNKRPWMADALGVSSGRIKRLEEGEEVKDRALLVRAYKYYIEYMEEYFKNTELRNILHTMAERNRQCRGPATSGQRRSVI